MLNQRSRHSVQILGSALVTKTLLNKVLKNLRTNLLSKTTKRIDQPLGAVVIGHSLRPPLSY